MRLKIWTVVLLSAMTGSGLAGEVKVEMDRLTVISSQPESTRDEIISAFKESYRHEFRKEIVVNWLDQGGSYKNLAALKAERASGRRQSRYDVIWGGGELVFEDLARLGLLAPTSVPKSFETVRDENQKSGVKPPKGAHPVKRALWRTSVYSSFGIFYATDGAKTINLHGRAPFADWEDLVDPALMGKITMPDPRFSSVAGTIVAEIVSTLGWKKGWETLIKAFANAAVVTNRTSESLNSVITGATIAVPAIDFLALQNVKASKGKFKFSLPKSGHFVDPDPIAIVKGARHAQAAERFVNFVLSEAGQRILALPHGTPGGPKSHDIGRIPVNLALYGPNSPEKLNPMVPSKAMSFKVNRAVSVETARAVMDDAVGAILVDCRPQLLEAWRTIHADPIKTKALVSAVSDLVGEAQVVASSRRWGEYSYRDETIAAWISKAKLIYGKFRVK